MCCQLRGFIRKLRKRLSKRKRARLGLSSDGVVRVKINAKGKKVVLLDYSLSWQCNLSFDKYPWLPAKVRWQIIEEHPSLPEAVLCQSDEIAHAVCGILPISYFKCQCVTLTH